MKTSLSPLKASARKPSHLGSKRYSPLAGSSSASLASMGSTGGAMAYNWLAALGFCYLRAIGIARPRLGELRAAAKYLLAFALACTTALAWEIAEFIVDQLAGMALQQGNFDTMSDLIFGTVGAAAYLTFHAVRNSGTGA